MDPENGDFRIRPPGPENNYTNPLIGAGMLNYFHSFLFHFLFLFFKIFFQHTIEGIDGFGALPYDILMQERTVPYDVGAYKYDP